MNIEIRGKKILLIGNGFDLAHGLPTKYTDFLGFVERFENFRKFVKMLVDNPTSPV